MNQFDTDGLYQFLTTTPEKGLRKTLIDNKFSEIHFNVLMKIVRSSNQEQFADIFSKQDFPKIKYSDKENQIKPKFWKECEVCLTSRGLLTSATSKIEKKAA